MGSPPFRFVSLFAVLLAPTLPAIARADDLSEMFAPTSGHLEMQSAIWILIDGVQVETLEDVLALRDKLNNGPLVEASVTSWKFLERAGLKKRERPTPAPPPGINPAMIRRVPDWRQVTFDFQGELRQFTTSTPKGETWSMVTTGPRSCVRIDQRGDRRIYQHFTALSSWSETNMTCDYILGRDRYLFARSGELEAYGEQEIFTDGFGNASTDLLLVDRQRDALWARFDRTPESKRIRRFTLYLQLRSQEKPRPHEIPTLTMHFQRGRGGWMCDCFFIEKAVLDVEIPPERFVVDVPAGEPYEVLGQHPPVVLSKAMMDITSKTPETIARELNLK